MANVWSDLVGASLDSYPLRELLRHADGSAEYLTAHDGQPAALRVIAAGERTSEDCHRSWTAALELDHPNLVRVFAVGRTAITGNPAVYVVSEHPDDSLADAVAARALAPDEAHGVVEAVASALEYLHNRNLAHGSVQPSSIVAVGDRVKLTVDSIGVSAGAAVVGDVQDLGATVVEILTQQRPRPGERAPALARIPPPFREIALGCLRDDPARRWKIADVRAALRGELPSAPAPEPVRALPRQTAKPRGGLPRLSWVAIAGMLALVLVLGLALLRRAPSAESTRPVGTVARQQVPASANRSRITNTTPQAPVTLPSPVPEPPPAQKAAAVRRGDWAVVAAIYRDYDAAAKRAQSLRRQAKGLSADVFPRKGEGRRYMVVLGTGLTRDEAERLRARARSQGMPRDSYVTRLPQG